MACIITGEALHQAAVGEWGAVVDTDTFVNKDEASRAGDAILRLRWPH